MKVQTDLMREGINIVSQAVARRSTLPVLSNIALSSPTDDRLLLEATDNAIAVRHNIPASGVLKVAITLPAKLLSNFVSLLPYDDIDIEVAKKTMTAHLVSGLHEANIKGISYNEFPQFPTLSLEHFSVPADVLQRLIKNTIISAALDSSRPILTGCLIELSNTTMRMTTADGFRLSTGTVSMPGIPSMSLLIPARAFKILNRIISDEVHVSVDDKVIFRSGSTELVSGTIEGNCPDYNQIVPEYDTQVLVNTDQLKNAVHTVMPFSTSNIVKLLILSDEVQISAMSPDTGGAHVSVEAESDLDELNIAFNGQYLMDILKVSDDTLRMMFNTSTHAGSFTYSDFVHVIMPMHTS